MSAARWICNGQEYLLRLLGAVGFEGDPSSLTLNGMLDIRKLDWCEEVCRAAGIDVGKLPPIGKPGARVGSISAEASGVDGPARWSSVVPRRWRPAMRGGWSRRHQARNGRDHDRYLGHDGGPSRPS